MITQNDDSSKTSYLGCLHIFGIKLDSVQDYIELRKSLIWFTLIERIIWVYVIMLFANKLNRQPLGWEIFAFLVPYLALIVIGLTPKVDNNFYEYKNSANKEQFFSSLSLTDKLKLYKHILYRAKLSFAPHWFDKIIKFHAELFADEKISLETLQQYEKTYNKNLLAVIKSNLPSSSLTRQEYLKSLEQLGIMD